MKIKKYIPKEKNSILKNKKTYTYLIGLGIILLMISSALTDYADNENEEIEYNNYLFFTDGSGSWLTNYEGQQLQFQYNPKELEDIQFDQFSFTPRTYLILNDPYNLNQFEIKRITSLMRFKCINPQLACKSETECDNNELPIINCNDDTLVLEFKSSENNTLTKENNCIIVNHNNNRIIEKLSFKILGII